MIVRREIKRVRWLVEGMAEAQPSWGRAGGGSEDQRIDGYGRRCRQTGRRGSVGPARGDGSAGRRGRVAGGSSGGARGPGDGPNPARAGRGGGARGARRMGGAAAVCRRRRAGPVQSVGRGGLGAGVPGARRRAATAVDGGHQEFECLRRAGAEPLQSWRPARQCAAGPRRLRPRGWRRGSGRWAFGRRSACGERAAAVPQVTSPARWSGAHARRSGCRVRGVPGRRAAGCSARRGGGGRGRSARAHRLACQRRGRSGAPRPTCSGRPSKRRRAGMASASGPARTE